MSIIITPPASSHPVIVSPEETADTVVVKQNGDSTSAVTVTEPPVSSSVTVQEGASSGTVVVYDPCCPPEAPTIGVSADPGNAAILGSDGLIYVPEGAVVPYDVEIDERPPANGDVVTYIGQAVPGSATSDPAWRIKRITDSGGAVSIDWAAGSASQDQVWDDRYSLVYGP